MKKLQNLLLSGLVLFAIPFSSIAQQCEGAHSSSQDDSWLSCVETENPNPDRSEGHWILYDLGNYYELNESHFWNYNVSGETDRGVANMVVDWSIDGTTWNWWGDINLAEAPGQDNYFGEPGPNFEGLVVRYLLLSITSNHGGNCYGFSELKLDVTPGVVDIEEISIATFEFGIHPNPAKDQTTLQIDDFNGSTVNLYNPAGQIVETYFPTSSSTKIDLINLASGSYMVEVIDASGVKAAKRLNVIQ